MDEPKAETFFGVFFVVDKNNNAPKVLRASRLLWRFPREDFSLGKTNTIRNLLFHMKTFMYSTAYKPILKEYADFGDEYMDLEEYINLEDTIS